MYNYKQTAVYYRPEIQEDPDFIYLRSPRGFDLRISRTDFKVYAQIVGSTDWKELKFNPNNCGQYRGSLHINGKNQNIARDRVICIAFHGEPTTDKPFVKHKDGDNKNFNPSNLEWSSQRGVSRTIYMTDEQREALSTVAEGERTGTRKAYYDVYNKLKGSDGLTHTQRYYKRLREAGIKIVKRWDADEQKYKQVKVKTKQ